jgi:hypothetical protein
VRVAQSRKPEPGPPAPEQRTPRSPTESLMNIGTATLLSSAIAVEDFREPSVLVPELRALMDSERPEAAVRGSCAHAEALRDHILALGSRHEIPPGLTFLSQRGS